MFSQHDPAYDRLLLGKSKLTIHGYGCLLVSIANLYQKSPVELLKVAGGVTADGLVVSNILAQYCGGAALPKTTQPPVLNQWCIAMTDKFKEQGFPTHFFCVNMATKQQIDPLDFPAQIEPLSYPIVEWRPFTNVKLTTVEPWQDSVKRWCIENGIISTWGTPEDAIMLRVGAAIRNYHNRFGVS